MKFSATKALLLATAMLVAPAAAYAQPQEQMAEPPADAVSPDDPSLQAVSDAEANASAQEAKMSILQAQIEALQSQLDEVKKTQAKNAPVWKGAPQFSDPSGFTWKIRGRFMYDAGYVGDPGVVGTPSGFAPGRYGFNNRIRRLRLGVEGTLPGDFGYKFEADFANAAVGFGDAILTWNPKKGPWTVTLGNFESLDGMEQITSSRWSSFIERSQMNDAFGNTRRLGVALGWVSQDKLLRADVGLFSTHSIDASLDNQGWIGATRITYTPYAFGGFVHMGVNYQHREFQGNNGTTALDTTVGSPSSGQLVQYRARPFLQLTDQRFVGTGNFAAKSDNIVGLELYGVFKSLHLGGEAQWAFVNAYKAGNTVTGMDAFASAPYLANGNPTFFSIFGEVGYFLTGETRGYKNGLWDRTKVLHPIDQGGIGAIQLLGRLDYLNLDSNEVQTGCTSTGASTLNCTPAAAANLTKGGKQIGYLAGVTWIPTDYVRFLLNYIHTEVRNGPFSTVGNRAYSTDSVAVRAQFDF